MNGPALGDPPAGSAAMLVATLAGADISIATNSGWAPIFGAGAGALLGAGDPDCLPASLVPRPARHWRTRLAFRPCASATPEIDAPGSSQAARTFALNSAP
jgi:hypothetical protein